MFAGTRLVLRESKMPKRARAFDRKRQQLAESPGHAATGGAFTLLRFPQHDLPDIVYLEHLTSALYLDKRDDVETYTQTLDLLAATNPAPQQTEQLLTELLDRLAG